MTSRVGLDGRALGNINKNRGIGRYTARLVEALCGQNNGFELVLFGYGDGPEPGLIDSAALESIEWHRLSGFERSAYGDPRGHLRFARAVNDSGVGLFHGIDHNMTPFLSCRSIVTVHDLIPLVLRGPYLGPKSWLWMKAHRAACRKADRVIAVSDSTRDDVERLWNIPADRIEVVAEGVSSDYVPVSGAELEDALARYGISQPYFLYIGGFDPRKNIGNMLVAFKRYLHGGGQGVIVLCGDTGGFEEYLCDEIDQLGMRDSVLLPGFIDDDDLPALYSGARALVFVSTYEGFGLPLLEAMACDTPVLASDVSSIPGVVGKAAVMVDPLDPSAIARGLAALSGESAERSELVRLGRERAAQFTWDKAASRISGIYDDVLRGGAR